ncbi:hypothetical protein FIBSPDRAFT_961089 [Athelia psychrophila]|uniref:Uncharacterized protein n=1 Tax=Athelia psychrophila TaxID=1759441 RepID=A0A166BLM8_9AGAM|nr:hypothetical protein FIBSPDRAFT_961089 [Fibularhizoctonia sp. CBS 109695]
MKWKWKPTKDGGVKIGAVKHSEEVAPGSGSAPIRSALAVYATILPAGVSRARIFQLSSTKGYIHVVQTSGYNVGKAKGAKIKLAGSEGGAAGGRRGAHDARGRREVRVQNIGSRAAEVLLFEIE